MVWDWKGVVLASVVLASLTVVTVLLPYQKETLVLTLVGAVGTVLASLRGPVVSKVEPPPPTVPEAGKAPTVPPSKPVN